MSSIPPLTVPLRHHAKYINAPMIGRSSFPFILFNEGRVAEACRCVPDNGCFLNTFNELMLHVAFTKLVGSMILSAHVPGHPLDAYELPAQSPQNVISNTIEWFAKKAGMLHCVFRSLAEGVPHNDGFGEPAIMSVGIAAR